MEEVLGEMVSTSRFAGPRAAPSPVNSYVCSHTDSLFNR
jgi:hypothetical protein